MSSLENPFASQKPLKHDDAGYIEAALGKEDAELFRSIDDEGKKKKKVETPRGSLELTEEEKKLVETEKKERAERPWTKKQYIEWADEIGLDEDWVERTFTFRADGTTTVEGSLLLQDRDVSRLPNGIALVTGVLNISKNPLVHLKNFPLEVRGSVLAIDSSLVSLAGMHRVALSDVRLARNQLQTLDGISEEVRGDLDLTDNRLVSLKALPKTITGDLFLQNNPDINHFPADVHVSGTVFISRNQRKLAAALRKRGIEPDIR